jgi:hydroxymethylbilane synthase
MTQARTVAALLERLLGGRSIAIDVVSTRGDTRQDVSLTQLGEGVFVRAIEEELLAGRADVAVHSFKDMPAAEASGLVVSAVPVREDPRDAVVTRDGCMFADLPQEALLATGSPRRVAQLRALRPDLRFTGVRGNVDTRLRKLDSGEFDGLVIAVAGLNRLGLEQRIATIFEVDECTPAVGQGALAIQCRRDDDELLALLGQVDDTPTHLEARAERAFLVAIGGGCRVPVGALARHVDGSLLLSAVVADEEGVSLARLARTSTGVDPEKLGRLVADDLKPAMDRAGAAS